VIKFGGAFYRFCENLTSVAVGCEILIKGVAGMLRNGWPACPGIGGRNQSEWVADINRNQWPEWSGICMLYQDFFSFAEGLDGGVAFGSCVD
jgi:hypothetical protein